MTARRAARRALPLLAAAWLAGCATPPAAPPAEADGFVAPEAATGSQAKAGTRFARQAVAAAHPLASAAGLEMLRAGGSAADAAVAVQAVLTLVEPQSSGIGGGAFVLLWDGHEVQAWDGRETAPAAADPRSFLGSDGRELPYEQRVFGGRSVGVPGVLRMLEAVHRAHGRLPWARLFEPAIRLAEQGFPVGPRLHALLTADRLLRRDAQAAALFYRPDGSAHPVGHLLTNPALAAVLRAVAAQGADALHRGPIAEDIVRRVRGHAAAGAITSDDLAGYRPVRRGALCTDWREVWRVCGMPPPSSGHIALMQTLAVLDQLPEPLRGPAVVEGVPGPQWLHAYAESARLAFADRSLWLADPDRVAAPAGDWASLLDRDYLAERAGLVGERRRDAMPPGRPRGTPLAFAPAPLPLEQGTSHVSIVDARGLALALTSSVESAFGARLMSDGGTGLPGGFLLNNQLTDFSAQPLDAAGRPVANRLEGGKRPRSSMSPTLVFDRRAGAPAGPVLVLGSPLGALIPHLVARTMLATLDWGLDAQQAVDTPAFAQLGGPLLLERGRFPEPTLLGLRQRGHSVAELDIASGLQVLQRRGTGWLGGADPRREGVVLGD